MGRMNNNRTRARNAEFAQRSARSRFSNWKPPPKKSGGAKKGAGGKDDAKGAGRSAGEGSKNSAGRSGKKQPISAALLQKLQKNTEKKKDRGLKPANQHMLKGVKVSGLDSVELSETQLQLITSVLREFGVFENIESLEQTLKSVSPNPSMASEPTGRPPTTPESQKVKTFSPRSALGRPDDLGDRNEELSESTPLPEAPAQGGVFEYLTETLSFGPDQAALAIRSTSVSTASSTLPPGLDAKAQQAAAGAQLSAALDWLCLHLDQGALRAGFRQRGRPELEVVAPGSRGAPAPAAVVRTVLKGVGEMEIAKKTDWALEHRSLVICKYGFTADEASQVLNSMPDLFEVPDFEEAMLSNDRLLAALLELLQPPLPREDPVSSEEAEDAIAEEIMVLESIFPEELKVMGPRRLRLDLDLGLAPPAAPGAEVHVLLPPGYPNRTPLVWVAAAPALPPGLLRLLHEGVGREMAAHLREGAMVFSLAAFLKDHARPLQRQFAGERAEEEEIRRGWGGGGGNGGGAQAEGHLQEGVSASENGLKLEKKEKKKGEDVIAAALQKTQQFYIEKARKKTEDEYYAKEAQRIGNSAYFKCLNDGGTPEEAKAAMKKAKKEYLGEPPSDDDGEGGGGGGGGGAEGDSSTGAGPGGLGAALEGIAATLAEKLAVSAPIARALVMQVTSPKYRRRGGGGGGRGGRRRRNHALLEDPAADPDRRREAVLREAVELHFQKQEDRDRRLAALTEGINGEDEQELPPLPSWKSAESQFQESLQAQTQHEPDKAELDDRKPSVSPSPAVGDARKKLNTSEFKPSPYLEDIMKHVTETVKSQPWLLKHQETQRDDLNAIPELATLEVEPTAEDLARENAVSQQLKEALERKRQEPAYRSLLTKRKILPAYQMQDQIVDAIEHNQVVVISGATGCGKTTQVPQLVLDRLIDAGVGARANVLVTQPRRISAIGVAERIAQERAERVGQTAGYQIRLESKRTAQTRLLLCTTGVLLRRLQCDGALATVSHVFVDEVHERDLNTDFLLIILRDLLPRRPKLKVVLMSATLNAGTFARYFHRAGVPAVPVVEIPGRAHPVQALYLEDVLERTGYEVDPRGEYAKKKPKGGGGRGGGDPDGPPPRTEKSLEKALPAFSEATRDSLRVVDESIINYELVASLLEYICQTQEPGAILVFMPGMMEITKTMEKLAENPLFSDKSRCWLYALHSSLSTEEQTKIFEVPPVGIRKIIVSTNIAETSITVEDVVYVVDSGRVKENRYDDVNMMATLVECWASRAAEKQRRGRAGRVRPGMAFHLFSSITIMEKQLDEFQLPEMLRTSLDDLILQILLLDLGDPTEFLNKAVNPPSELMLSNSINHLAGLQAIELDEAELPQLTALGYHLATLPVEPRIGKMLLYSAIFGCVGPVVTIAAALSGRNPFAAPFHLRDQADEAKRRISKEEGVDLSDHLTLLRAYDLWKQSQKGGRGEERAFLRDNFLSRNTLSMISQMRKQFLDLLKDIGFIRRPGTNHLRLEHENDSNLSLVRAVVCAGLYPNVVVAPSAAVKKPGQKSGKKVGEHALMSTRGAVYFHPCSASFEADGLSTRYIIYHEMVKTSKVYIRDGTTVSPFTLVLFGGELTVHHQQEVVTVDGWLHFRAARKTAALLRHLRLQTEAILLEQIANPDGEVSGKGRNLVMVLDALLADYSISADQPNDDFSFNSFGMDEPHISGGGGTCHRCGEQGHFARECPNGGAGGGASGGACFNCGGNHFARECPNNSSGPSGAGGGGAGGACHRCGLQGHFARECPNNQGSAAPSGSVGSNPASSACYNCGGPHFARDCQQQQQESRGGGAGGGGAGACHTCGNQGHFARDCPQGSRGGGGGGGACRSCGQPGHFARECPKSSGGGSGGGGRRRGAGRGGGGGGGKGRSGGGGGGGRRRR